MQHAFTINRMHLALSRVLGELGHWYDSQVLLDKVRDAMREAVAGSRGALRVSIAMVCSDRHLVGHSTPNLWSLMLEASRLRSLVKGRVVVVGYHTWMRLRGTMPWRHAVVVSRRHDARGAGVTQAESVHDALVWASTMVADADEEVMVIGGAGVFRDALPYASRLYVGLLRAGPVIGDMTLCIRDADWSPIFMSSAEQSAAAGYRYMIHERAGPPAEKVLLVHACVFSEHRNITSSTSPRMLVGE